MAHIEDILRLKAKPKEKQRRLVNAVTSKEISAKDFIAFFESASDVDKGTCADVMKHVAAEEPAILAPYVDILVEYINYKAPRVKWGVPEAIGTMAQRYPEKVEKSIPYLLKNTIESEVNTTVVRWCAAYALTEIAKFSPKARQRLVPVFQKKIEEEKNNGVRNVYVKAMKSMTRE